MPRLPDAAALEEHNASGWSDAAAARCAPHPHPALAHRVPAVPGIALMVICLTAGGLIRDVATNYYYGKPRPVNLDYFTKALLARDIEIYEQRKSADSEL